MDVPRGFIQTVLGAIEPGKLGPTLCHEHLYQKSRSNYFVPNPVKTKYSYLNSTPVIPENLWYTTFHYHVHEDNLDFTEPSVQELIQQELVFFKSNGGSSMVEVTTFGKDLRKLAEYSAKTNVNIVGNTGYYVHTAFPESVTSLSTEELYNTMQQEFINGIDGIKPGVIGELGSCWPIHPFERRVLVAAGQLQQELRAPVIIHPGRHPDAPFEIMRIFAEAGGNASKTVMSHLERTLEEDRLLEFADSTGSICEFDLFGNETSYYEAADNFDMPNDGTRIKLIQALIGAGFSHQITISHDIHTKHRLMKFGGHGFSHILLNVIPKMLRRGVTQQQIDQIMVETPKNWLTL